MTRLTYRGNKYYKESFLQQDLQNWNDRHRPSLWLRYRGRKYRPVQVGGQYSKELNKLQTSDSL